MKILISLLSLLILFYSQQGFCESITVDLGSSDSFAGPVSARIIQFIGLITILSIAPSILIMMTSFTRIAVVFSILRSAMGLQQSPSNQMLVSLAIFLTIFIMSPTFEKSYEEGIKPLIQEEISEEVAFSKTIKPFRDFMLEHVRQKDLELFAGIAKIEIQSKQDIPWGVLIPGFMISELKRAFEIGFLLFLPFLIIDILISSILMSVGMMMLPPVIVSLPFKIVFFVLIDGWYLVCGSLVKSYGG